MPSRRNWDPERMQAAVEAMRNKEMGSYKASRVFNVPQTTLERYVKNISKTPEAVVKTQIGRKQVLPPEIETDLAEHCLLMEKRYFGLSMSDVMRLAYQLAARNGLKHSFSKTKEKAGKKWLRNFLRRNPQLSVRTPEGLSFARAKNFTPERVAEFFDIFEPAMDVINHNPSRLYNCDETGVTVVQHKQTKILAMKGKRQIASLQSAERGSLITVVTCMNPSGHFIPPLFVFPRKNMKAELMDGTPLGSVSACHPSGWIQSDIFTQWFRHFIKYTKPSAEDPVVLVLDGHYSHTRNLDVINLARENHIEIICLPPHSSHRMQPLDVAFMGPLKTFYCQEIEKWLRANPGRIVTVYQIGQLFGNAYRRAATGEIAASGFRAAGLFPCDRNVFKPSDFPFATEDEASNSAAASTSRQTSSSPLSMSPPRPTTSQEQVRPSDLSHSETTTLQERVHSSDMSPSGSTSQERVRSSDLSPSEPTSQERVRSSDISPVPSLKLKPNDRTGAAKKLTSSPYKKVVEEAQRKKEQREKDQRKKEKTSSGLKGKRKLKAPAERSRKRLHKSPEPSVSSESEEDLAVPLDDDSDSSDAECFYCSGMFSEDNNGEDWIRCSRCLKWAHTLCADGSDIFICELCRKK